MANLPRLNAQTNGAIAGECLHTCVIGHALAGLSVGLAIVNPAGRVVWLNRTAEQVLGRTLAESVGRPVSQVFRDPQLAAFWQDAGQSAGNRLGELSLRWPTPMELKVNATHWADADGTVSGRALLLCDVTEDRAVQVKLSRAVADRLLGLTAGHMPPEPVAGLTQQELRVLRLLGRGLGNAAIAGRISVSSSTVRSHLKNMYRKLSLSSRAEAVSYAVRNHLV